MRPTSRLPRGIRVPAILLAGLVVASALGWGLFVQHPAPESPERPAFLAGPDEPLPAPAENESYRVTVRMSSNFPELDDQVIVRQRAYVPGRNPVVKDSQVATGDADVVQYVSYRRGDAQYVRKTVDDRGSFRRQVDDPGVVRSDPTSLTYYEVDRATRRTAGIDPGEAVRGLYMLRYERAGTTTYQGREVVRFRAVSGWTSRARLDGQGTQSIYVRQAEGEVLVDPDRGAILDANVTGSFVRGDTWSDVMTAKSYSITVEYSVELGVDGVSRPPWVASVNETDATQESRDRPTAT